MAIIKFSDLKKSAKSVLSDRARKLIREGRVYRVVQDDEAWRAMVLSDLQPESTTLVFERQKLSWTCSCKDHEPCVHLLGLLFWVQGQGQVPKELAEILQHAGSSGKKAREPRSFEGEFDFFEEAADLQPSLFDEPQEAPPRREKEKSGSLRLPPAAERSVLPEPGQAPAVFLDEPLLPATARPKETISSQDLLQGKRLSEHDGNQWAHHVHPWEQGRSGPPQPDYILEEHSPRFQLQFSETLGRTDIRLVVRYGDFIMGSSDYDPVYRIPGTTRAIKRDLAGERAYRDRVANLLEGKLAWERGLYAGLVGNDTPDWGLLEPLGDFLVETGYHLMALGFDILVFGRKILGSAKLSVTCEHDMDWFGVSARVRLDEAPAKVEGEEEGRVYNDLDLALDSSPVSGLVSTKEGYVALHSADLRRLAFLQKWGMDAQGNLSTSSVNLSLIDTLYDQLENKDDAAIQESHQALAEISTVLDAAYRSAHAHGIVDEDADPESHGFHVPEQPPGLEATLRLYQLIGFSWLRTLHSHGYGACLADDMGLGKTMQTLALLCSLKAEGKLGPSLLVSPVVTLSNWESELKRFAPGISHIRHQGARRSQTAEELRSHDLVIVSYQTLRNDLDLFASHEWDMLILDEAHYIKNASSQIFKAVRVLSGKHRLSLTGTPIENNTMELYAQFSFLNPGLLGSIQEFQEQFAGPIERKNDDTAAQVLRETVRPFILRRKKQEVLKELPDKIESVFWVDMDTAQAELYEAHRKRYQEIILGLLDTQGMEKSRMEVFRYLLRLRQLAIHPVLADPGFAHVPSAKLEALMLMLTDLVGEDNKVLVFSQFTSTLDLVGTELQQRGWKYSYLSGKTKDRQGEIERFKSEADKKIFLLSLKAGGVGINLTQANYVVLFDPWWNPAAENQAVDRAYRMGQTRNVSAYKFISRGTIEEKILALQGRKTLLSEAIVSPGGASLLSLDEDTVRNLFS